MKIRDFKFNKAIRENSSSIPVVFATLTIETGFWLWKKVWTRTIYKDWACWKYLDTGEFCENKIEKLAGAATAKLLLDKYKAQS